MDNRVISTSIPDVYEIRPVVHGDDRGYFFEAFRSSWLERCGVHVKFVQQNQSFSQQGVLRGLHYQLHQPQGKLVRALQGKIFDVAVDVRRDSGTFGQWVGVILDDQQKNSLWVPPGFAHGFLVLSKTAEINYQCTEYYNPESEHSLLWNDPAIGIEWPEVGDVKVSSKDAHGHLFVDAPKFITAEPCL